MGSGKIKLTRQQLTIAYFRRVNLEPFDLFFIAFSLAMFLLTVILSNVLYKQDKKIQLGDTSGETKQYRKDIARMRKILFVIFGVLIVVYGMYHYSMTFVSH
jgi:hypothetical protein